MKLDSRFTILLLTSAFAALNARAQTATYTNGTSADAFVRVDAPTSNYGGAGALSVSGDLAVNGASVANGAFDSFLRFNSAAMVAGFNTTFGGTNWTVTNITLRVVELGAPSQTLFNRGVGQFEIRWIANDGWTEGTGIPTTPTADGLSYTDEASLLNAGTDVTLGTFSNNGTDGPISFPLALPAAFVNDMKSGGEVGLFFTAVSREVGFTVDSRSFNTASSRPMIIVTAAKTAAPAGPPALIPVAADNGRFRFQFNAESNRAYTVEFRDALSSSNWTTLTNIAALPAVTNLMISNAMTNDARFYRVRTP